MPTTSDEDLERELLLRQMGSSNTGVSGYGFPDGVEVPGLDPGAAAADAASPTAPPATPEVPPAAAASYAMRGFDQGKLGAPTDQQSEKYKIGNVMKGFDPKAGVTPDMIAALNALGIAEFSGSGDKLTVNNTKNDPRFGKGGTGDVVFAHDAQNADTAWQPWFVDDGGSAPPGGSGAASAPGVSSVSSASGGRSTLIPTDDDFYQRLQQQLLQILGGSDAVDREQLVRHMGAG